MADQIGILPSLSVDVEAMLGILLLYIWAQNTEIKAVAWWASAHIMRVVSLALFGMFGSLPNAITIDLANAILLTSFAVTWTGARLFAGRKVDVVFLFEGTVIWLIAAHMSGFSESIAVRSLLSSFIIASYTWLAAAELWRNDEDQLVSRVPTVAMLFAQGVMFLAHTLRDVPLGGVNKVLFESAWLSALSQPTLLYTISIAFLLMAMSKERSSCSQNVGGLVDPITGIWNRQGFIAENNRLFEAMQQRIDDATMLLIHFDNFKEINQRMGRAIGHRALEILVATIKTAVDSPYVIGRLNVEEIAVVLFGEPRERLLAIAEQIRSSFADRAAIIGGQPVGATVSIGLTTPEEGQSKLTEVHWMADRALCRAKEGGNRVEIFDVSAHRAG